LPYVAGTKLGYGSGGLSGGVSGPFGSV
jgi:hypothetical protein